MITLVSTLNITPTQIHVNPIHIHANKSLSLSLSSQSSIHSSDSEFESVAKYPPLLLFIFVSLFTSTNDTEGLFFNIMTGKVQIVQMILILGTD
jgi:hypothetical protein